MGSEMCIRDSQRYLINQIRENFGLEHTPIRLVIRERGSGEVGAKDV